MTFGSLFAGIGGFDLGLERAGMVCNWQVENAPFATKILESHWPNVRRWSEVETFPPKPVNEWRVDLICGGFPCQPVSRAGKKLAQRDSRWLWPEFQRVLRVLRPRFAVVENVGGLRSRGLEIVLGGLAEIGFDAEWAMLPASAFGAAHIRERLFVFAYPSGDRLEGRLTAETPGEVATPSLDHLHNWPAVSAPFGLRSAHGVSDFVDRIRCLGNAVVPHIAEWIGRRILEVR